MRKRPAKPAGITAPTTSIGTDDMIPLITGTACILPASGTAARDWRCVTNGSHKPKNMKRIIFRQKNGKNDCTTDKA